MLMYWVWFSQLSCISCSHSTLVNLHTLFEETFYRTENWTDYTVYTQIETHKMIQYLLDSLPHMQIPQRAGSLYYVWAIKNFINDVTIPFLCINWVLLKKESDSLTFYIHIWKDS